jgi:hypothetical protein
VVPEQIGEAITNSDKETVMISGAHSIIYSTNPDADRAFFRDVLSLPHVDVGGGRDEKYQIQVR